MRILDRYILKSVLGMFFSCLFTFLFLYIIVDVFSHLDEILKQGVDLEALLQYYLSYLPIIFVQVTPISCLLSTLYTFSKFNRDNEIVAMRASGLSIPQITRAVIIFGIIMSGLVFWTNDNLVPQSLTLTKKIRENMESGARKLKEKEEVITDLYMYGLKNRLFSINKFIVATNTMEDIIILEHDKKQNLDKKIVADKGIYADGVWRFYNSVTYTFDENGQIIGEPQYNAEEIMTITETPRDFLTQKQQPDFMNIAQLNNYIWKLSASGATAVVRNLKVDLYQRFAFPLTSAIIILLGIPFSLKMKKRATGLSSLGISIMVGFLYFVLNAISIALGKSGMLTPFLSASLIHILGFLSSLYLISKLP